MGVVHGLMMNKRTVHSNEPWGEWGEFIVGSAYSEEPWS